MKTYQIAIIGGDGIGAEVVGAAKTVLVALGELEKGFALSFDDLEVSYAAHAKYQDPFPQVTIEGIRRSDAVLFGAAGGVHNVPVINGLRRGFDLYAKVCPIKSLPGSNAIYPNLDFIVVRENTEGSYRGTGFIDGDYHVNLRVFTTKGMQRIIRFCFDLALKEKRKKVTFTHKAQVLFYTDEPMRQLFHQIAKDYPSIEAEEMLVDTCAMRMVMRPEQFDIVLTENGNGDILSDLGAGLIGGLGFAYNGNIGDTKAVFEPTHGTGPDIAGKNIANPIAAIMAARMMLAHLGENAAGDRLERAVTAVLKDGQVRTPDLGGQCKTTDVADAIAKKLASV